MHITVENSTSMVTSGIIHSWSIFEFIIIKKPKGGSPLIPESTVLGLLLPFHTILYSLDKFLERLRPIDKPKFCKNLGQSYCPVTKMWQTKGAERCIRSPKTMPESSS